MVLMFVCVWRYGMCGARDQAKGKRRRVEEKEKIVGKRKTSQFWCNFRRKGFRWASIKQRQRLSLRLKLRPKWKMENESDLWNRFESAMAFGSACVENCHIDIRMSSKQSQTHTGTFDQSRVNGTRTHYNVHTGVYDRYIHFKRKQEISFSCECSSAVVILSDRERRGKCVFRFVLNIFYPVYVIRYFHSHWLCQMFYTPKNKSNKHRTCSLVLRTLWARNEEMKLRADEMLWNASSSAKRRNDLKWKQEPNGLKPPKTTA